MKDTRVNGTFCSVLRHYHNPYMLKILLILGTKNKVRGMGSGGAHKTSVTSEQGFIPPHPQNLFPDQTFSGCSRVSGAGVRRQTQECFCGKCFWYLFSSWAKVCVSFSWSFHGYGFHCGFWFGLLLGFKTLDWSDSVSTEELVGKRQMLLDFIFPNKFPWQNWPFCILTFFVLKTQTATCHVKNSLPQLPQNWVCCLFHWLTRCTKGPLRKCLTAFRGLFCGLVQSDFDVPFFFPQ